jgi:hypothetical protein
MRMEKNEQPSKLGKRILIDRNSNVNSELVMVFLTYTLYETVSIKLF